MLKSISNPLCNGKIQKHLWFHLSQAYSVFLEQNILRDNNDKLENGKPTVANENKEKHFEKPHINTITSHSNESKPSELKNSIPNAVEKKRKKKFNITPNVTWTKTPKTVLAIHVGPNIISWTYLKHSEPTFKVLDWNWNYWCTEGELTVKPYVLMNTISNLIEILPTADTYVTEDQKILSRNKNVRKLIAQHHLTTSIMSCIRLRNKLTLSSSENIYVCDDRSAGHWFNLKLGSEVISTENVIRLLIEDGKSYNGVSISVNEEIKLKLSNLDKKDKEQVNWSLLKAISFLSVIENMIKNKI